VLGSEFNQKELPQQHNRADHRAIITELHLNMLRGFFQVNLGGERKQSHIQNNNCKTLKRIGYSCLEVKNSTKRSPHNYTMVQITEKHYFVNLNMLIGLWRLWVGQWWQGWAEQDW
jgi:hypothetical protein